MNEARQLGRPGSHGELWQVYQIRNGMDRLLEEAQHIEQGHSGATQLVVRLGVLRSLARPVEGHHLFDFLPTARPETTRTLQRVSELSQRWLERVDWNDQASARATSAEILSELPPLQRAMHEVMVAANISLANELDEERQRLYGYFSKLAWALLGLLVGGALLVTHLIYNFREARRLSESLGELAHTLESRVEARTLALSEGRELLKHILEASPSDVALIGAESGRVHFVNQRLIVRQGLQRGSQFSWTGCSPPNPKPSVSAPPWRHVARSMTGRRCWARPRPTGVWCSAVSSSWRASPRTWSGATTSACASAWSTSC